MSLLIRKDGTGPWLPPTITRYENEKLLQDIIVSQPSLLPGVPEKGAVAVEELEVPGPGRIDIVCLDRAGEITLCECKLGRNPEIKREIVGQLLAYAAVLWQMSYEELDRRFAARTSDGRSIIEQMRAFKNEAHENDWSMRPSEA